MDRETIKKQNQVFKSLMSNPKLAKAYSEALAAPLGSTKREQAKAMFSIMKKVSGVRMDGRGGPMDAPQPPQSPTSTPPSYGNMMIFPAAPKFKVRNTSQPVEQQSTPEQAPAPVRNLFDSASVSSKLGFYGNTLLNKSLGPQNNGMGGLYNDGQGGTATVLKYGSSGDPVKELQTALKNAGYTIDVDGKFGTQTQDAVKQYQTKNQLDPDGIVGQMTSAKLFQPAATPVAPVVTPAATTPTDTSDKGLLAKGFDWYKNKVVPAVNNFGQSVATNFGKIIGTTAAAVAAPGQWLTQNVSQGVRELFPHDTPGKFISMTETPGSLAIQKMWPSLGTPTTVVPPVASAASPR